MAGTLTPRKRFQLGFPWRTSRLNFQDELESLLTNVFGDEEDGWPTGSLTPLMDLSETDATVEARMDLPGVAPDEIDIQIRNDMLTVSGERKEEKEEKDRTYHRIERRVGSFSRSMRLPCAVDEGKVTAKQKDGVLSISMPKSEAAKPHKVKVKT